MRNQLAEISPDLVLGYESDGTPILKNLQLQNKQLEAQIKLKQQSQRVEENALALDTQKQRVNDLKDCLNINSLLCEIEKLEKECNEDGFWNDTRLMILPPEIFTVVATVVLLQNIRIQS